VSVVACIMLVTAILLGAFYQFCDIFCDIFPTGLWLAHWAGVLIGLGGCWKQSRKVQAILERGILVYQNPIAKIRRKLPLNRLTARSKTAISR